MADLNTLFKMAEVVGTEDIYFDISITSNRRILWVYCFKHDTVTDSVFFHLSEVDKAVDWIKSKAANAKGVSTYDLVLELLQDEYDTKELNVRLFETANDDPELRHQLLMLALKSHNTRDIVLDIGEHYLDELSAPKYEDDWVDFKLEELKSRV